MAKPLILRFGENEFPFSLEKVDRSDLYGYVEIETVDEKGRKCSLATLADDGRTIVATGGTALCSLSPEGHWLEKSALTPVDSDGNPINPFPSSYSAPVPVQSTVTIDEYLTHNIRSIYRLSCESDTSSIMSQLKAGTIFTFPYSFRGGLEPDAAFMLLGADGTPFLAIGSATRIEFVGFDQAGLVEEESSGEDDEESLDFGMM